MKKRTCIAAVSVIVSAVLINTAVQTHVFADGLPETVELSLGSYAYTPEEIMYLSGVKAAANVPGVSYSLMDTDGDEISELFIKDEEEAVTAYRYDEETGRARLWESGTVPDDLSWVESSQWADGSIIGVAEQMADPGVKEDYYLSVNYDWLSEEHLQTPGDSCGSLDGLEESVAENRKAMLTDTEKYQGEDVQRLRDYYTLATNWDRRNAEGAEPVRKYLDAVDSVTDISGLTAYLTDPEKDPFCTMLGITVTLDERDTSHWAVDIAEDEFSVLPRIYHNSDKEDVEDVRYDFDVRARHVLERAGYDADTVEKILTECYEMEEFLLPLAWSDEDDEIGFQPLGEVVSACSRFPLKELLEAYQITEGNVRVWFPRYLKQLDELYTEEHLSMLKSYLMAHTAASACDYLDYQACTCLEEDPDYEETVGRLNRGYMIELLSPRGPLGVAEENAYMTYFAPEDVRADLTELAEEIRGAFREILQSQDWMSDEGKEAALEKLDSMSFSVMAPDVLIGSSYLEVDPDGCFLDECAKLRVSTLKHNLAFAGKERVKGDWRYDLRPEIATSETNAFYYGSFNQFFILAGFVNDSIYRPDMSKEEKLAKLGEIVGHELTHGFDPQGIRYDKDGNLVATEEDPCGWMPEDDYAAFRERTEKVVAYFDRIKPFPYDSCNGDAVKEEAVADIGGLAIGLKIAEDIENFDYDRFFRSHADLWHLQTTLVRERSDIYNEHPLYYLRINSVVQQFDEFYDTYDIAEGDGMYLSPDERIAVWAGK